MWALIFIFANGGAYEITKFQEENACLDAIVAIREHLIPGWVEVLDEDRWLECHPVRE